MIRLLLFSFIVLFAVHPARAQLYSTQYRLPDQEWMELNTDHFRLIYPKRYQTEAYRSMTILESEYSDIQKLVGGSMNRFPILLNPENDLSNGFVSTLNFRSEVELSPIISKTMNPKSGDWLEFVLPHELVHAMHFSGKPESVTNILSLFSPDIRRSTHTAAPSGFLEGIAVEYESHNQIPQAGRGHHPYFRNQFRSVLHTNEQWSMGQLIHSSTFTLPFDRHYKGGYEFVNWFLDTHGNESMKNAIDYHYKYPFLGFGAALKHETGYWPSQLYKQFNELKTRQEAERLNDIGNSADSVSEEVPFSGTCKRIQRPQWLNNTTLLFYGRGCNRLSGFYTYNIQSNSFELLHEVVITDDFIYSLTDDKSHILYSRYHTDLLYDNLFRSDLHKLHVETRQSLRITKEERVFSPALMGDELFALQTQANEMNLVQINPENGERIHTFSKPEHATIVQIAPNPYQPKMAAIIGRINSIQGIWFENTDKNSVLESDPAVVFENGSVFDLAWHPSDEKFLFVSDHTGTMNIYEYDVPSRQVVQITNSLYNAFEASYSPDGNQIVYIKQDGNEQKLYLLHTEDAFQKIVPSEIWQFNSTIEKDLSRPLMNRETQPDRSEWNSKPFSTGWRWIKPRLWVPTYEDNNGYARPGITLESVDVMSSQAYSLDASYLAERLWFSTSYINKSFYPGFEIDLFNRPSFTSFQTENKENETFKELLQESRGASLSIPFSLSFESNARFTSLFLEPTYSVSNIRFLDPEESSTPVSPFAARHTLGFQSIFNWNIRQFIRDIQPSAGWAFFIEGRHALNRDQFTIETEQLSVDGTATKRRGVNAGVIKFLSPLKRWNQSLRLSAEVYSQTDVPVFGVSSLFLDHFSDRAFPGANNIGILNTRYTIPLVYPDDGGLLLPLYLSNIYLVLFSETGINLDQRINRSNSRTLLGTGIRSRFRLSNLSIDIGISFGWEPTRNDVSYYFGDF